MKVVIFDGDCAFCNRSVLFILKNNKKRNLMVCSNQSAAGQRLITELTIKAKPEDTIIFVDGANVYSHSRGVLEISKHLKSLYPLLYISIIIPPFIRDGIYNFIAKRRKRLIKSNTCSFEMAKSYSAQIME
jgi:predicted DCC family thiol-disulfide oxidoreductase YuxK